MDDYTRPITPIAVSATTLTLHRPVHEIPEPLRTLVTRWLTEHGIDPTVVTVDAPVERLELHSGVSWVQQGADGGRMRHSRFPPVATTDHWPAPFPDELLRADSYRIDHLAVAAAC